MKNFDDWSRIITKNIKGEADLLAAIEKDDLDHSAAKQAFIRAVLEPLLPDSFAIGSGSIVDASGNSSENLDIIVYRRDFPKLSIPGCQPVFLFESVVAAFEVKTKLIRKSFFEALDHCASLESLKASVDHKDINSIAIKNGLKRGNNGEFKHPHPLITERFNLLSRPPAFIFAFNGMKTSYKQLQENIELWIDSRQQENKTVHMKSVPAVIATQGCFATRNSAPFSTNDLCLMGVGTDEAPIRFIVTQLLYNINRRLRTSANSFGVKPRLDAYLKRLGTPAIEDQIGFLPGSEKKAGNPEKKITTKESLVKSAKSTAATTPSPPRAAAAKSLNSASPVIKALKAAAPSTKALDSAAPAKIPLQSEAPAIKPPSSAAAEAEPQNKSAEKSDGSGAFVENIKQKAIEPKAESAPWQNMNGAFLHTIKQRIEDGKPARETGPDLQPTSEPEVDPFTETIPQ